MSRTEERSGLFAQSSSSSSREEDFEDTNSADVCVAIGSNLVKEEGESNASSRFQHFHTALRLLEERGFQIKKLAGVYESKPMDTLIENQPKISQLRRRVVETSTYSGRF